MEHRIESVGTWTRDATGASWGSILAGAVAAAALSLILLALGSGLGLSAVSPWSYEGASATGIGIAAIVWLLLMAVISSALGGYIAGRLRPKWTSVPTDETFFRDTAHGFLAWAVATIVSAALLTSAATAMVGTAAKATAAVAGTTVAAGAAAVGGAVSGGAAGNGGAASGGPIGGAQDYFVDMLYRGSRPADAAGDPRAMRSESTAILASALAQGELGAADRTYLAQLVAQRTGLSQADAEQRVTQVMTAAKAKVDAATAQAKAAAEQARKATLYAALWVFISLLLGAFSASLAATIGGRQRDEWSASAV